MFFITFPAIGGNGTRTDDDETFFPLPFLTSSY